MCQPHTCSLPPHGDTSSRDPCIGREGTRFLPRMAKISDRGYTGWVKKGFEPDKNGRGGVRASGPHPGARGPGGPRRGVQPLPAARYAGNAQGLRKGCSGAFSETNGGLQGPSGAPCGGADTGRRGPIEATACRWRHGVPMRGLHRTPRGPRRTPRGPRRAPRGPRTTPRDPRGAPAAARGAVLEPKRRQPCHATSHECVRARRHSCPHKRPPHT